MGIKADDRYPADVVAAYALARRPGLRQGDVQDYRAGAGIDRELDDADRGRRTIACPVRVLWGGDGALPRFYADPLELWRPFAPGATGRAVAGASHFLVEDEPAEVAEDLAAFLADR